MSNLDELITAGDISKLHSEINQYINQILSVTNQAITVFALAIFGNTIFGMDKVANVYQLRPYILAVPVALLILLMIMFIYCHSIAKQHNVLSTYLEVKKLSLWEDHYQDFAKNNRTLTKQNFYHLYVFRTLVISTIVLNFFLYLFLILGEQSQVQDKVNLLFGAFLVMSVLAVYVLYKIGGVEDMKMYRIQVAKEWCRMLNIKLPNRYDN